MADRSDRIYYKCPECSKVSYFQEGDPLICKQCGHAETVPDEGMSQASMFGLGGLIAAVAGIVFMPFLWFGFLLCAAAVALGIIAVAKSQEEDREDPTALALGSLAIVAGLGAALIIWWLWSIDVYLYGGSSYESQPSGSGGGDSGGGGSSGGGGTGGGGSGGGVDGGGGGVDVGTPFPGIPLIATSMWLLVQRMRRHA